MVSLLLRSLFFTILQPGVVAGLVPYLMLRRRGVALIPDEWVATHLIGTVLMLIGAIVLIVCVVRFMTEGKGTISPFDPTRELVVRGLYRYSRNPMYMGVVTLLAGEAIFWWSTALAVYTVCVFVAFNLFIMLHEEPRLEHDFPEKYIEYRRKVRRWI
jgi:protein-S-isoprenylcysteine O-methyltransferase Ste14